MAPLLRFSPLPALLALLAAAAAGCASDRQEIRAALRLGPGGVAEGRARLAGAELVSLRLHDAGPGQATGSVRTPSGRVLHEGPVGSLFLVFDEASHVEGEALVRLEAAPAAGSTVVYVLSGVGGVSLVWDVSRAEGPPPATR
jgi:hypothetical protein